MRYFSLDSPSRPPGYSSTLLPSVFSMNRAATAGASSATTEEVLNFMLVRIRGWYGPILLLLLLVVLLQCAGP